MDFAERIFGISADWPIAPFCRYQAQAREFEFSKQRARPCAPVRVQPIVNWVGHPNVETP